MDISQLRNFLKTVETMNFTRAAESLFISRQALRQSLTALEHELGQPLFETERNRLSLTQYGEYLARACRDTVESFDRMEADVTEFFRQDSVLRFAYSVSLSPYALPGLEPFVLRDFSAKFPHIRLEIIRCAADEVIRLVENREADLGCAYEMQTPHTNCEVSVIRTSPIAISFGQSSPFFRTPHITLEELATIPLVGMGDLEKIARPLWEDCQRRNIQLNYRVIPNTIDAFYLVRHDGAACLSSVPPNWNGTPPITVLEDYTWGISLLCPTDTPAYHSAQLLSSYLLDHYQALFTDPAQHFLSTQGLLSQ